MILVTGATGTIGQALSRQLHARGVRFKALVRSQAKGASLGHPYVIGDFDEPASLSQAMHGVDAVFLNGPAGEAMLRQHANVIECARTSGVRRIVRISSRGADADSPNPLARAHGQADLALASSGLEWFVLRPATFMQNLRRNAGTVRAQGKLFGAYQDGRIAFVDCEDIAACAAHLLLREGATTGHTYTLTGPAAITFTQIAEKLSAALGKPVQYVDLPPEQMLANMQASGMPAAFAQLMVRLMSDFARGGGGQVTSAVPELLGRPARDVDQFLRDNLDAFRGPS